MMHKRLESVGMGKTGITFTIVLWHQSLLPLGIFQILIDGRTKPDVGIVDFDPFEHKPIADAGCSLRMPK
jgi:hypothetical protein